MIDDEQEGDGPWNCSTPSVPLLAGTCSEITSLHLPGINKATIDPAERHARKNLEATPSEHLKHRMVSTVSFKIIRVHLYFA